MNNLELTLNHSDQADKLLKLCRFYNELNLELLVEKGVEIVSDISFEILDLIAAGKLVDEKVHLNGLTRVKTNADRISEELFQAKLKEKLPGIAIVSEQLRAKGLASAQNIARGQPYAIFDPIDGTIHLQNKDGQWILNLGFCVDGEPLIGICAVPAENKLYLGVKGIPSMEISLDGRVRKLLQRPTDREGLVFGICSLLDTGGNSKIQEIWKEVARLNNATTTKEFGSAYSYLQVANGTIDVFVNPGGNFHWDTVAQQVIMEGSGARLVEIDWCSNSIEIDSAKACRYDLNFIKDQGHIAARNGLTVKINPESRIIWRPVFD